MGFVVDRVAPGGVTYRKTYGDGCVTFRVLLFMGFGRLVCTLLLTGGHYETYRVLMYRYLFSYGPCNDAVCVVDCVASNYELS